MIFISSILNKIRISRLMNSMGCYHWGYKRGFRSATLQVDGITECNYKDFLSDIDYRLAHPINGPYSTIIDNKLYLPMLLHNYKEYVPEYYYFIDESGLLPLEDCPFNTKSVRGTIEDFFKLLNQKHILCFKHTHSTVGKGFMLVRQEGEQYFLNNKNISKEQLTSLVLSLRQYIVTEYVYQHSYASKICETSLNTLRFLCVWDDIKKEFFLARSFHRFGCNGNIVDNIGSGNGMLVFVDVEKGALTNEGSFNFHNKGDKYVQNIVHPDHNIALTGMKIPHFEEVKAKILEIANANSFLRYVGFDVAITEDGFKIIELNSLSSLDVTQQRSGFLKDSRIRKVLKK